MYWSQRVGKVFKFVFPTERFSHTIYFVLLAKAKKFFLFQLTIVVFETYVLNQQKRMNVLLTQIYRILYFFSPDFCIRSYDTLCRCVWCVSMNRVSTAVLLLILVFSSFFSCYVHENCCLILVFIFSIFRLIINWNTCGCCCSITIKNFFIIIILEKRNEIILTEGKLLDIVK